MYVILTPPFAFYKKMLKKLLFILFVLFSAVSAMPVFAQCPNDNFSAPHRFRIGELLEKNVSADFNNDGNIDAAASDSYSNAVFVMFGDGAGNLRPPVRFSVGLNPLDIAVGDFNGDGKPDIVAANYGSANVSLLVNGCQTLTKPFQIFKVRN